MVRLNFPKFEVSPIKRFVYTYRRILSIAYKVNPSFLILITLINSFWGLTNLPVLYINKVLIDVVIASIGKPDIEGAIKMVVLLVSLRALIEFTRAGLSRISEELRMTFTEQIVAYLERAGGVKLNSLDIPTVESPDFQNKFKKIERESNNRVWSMMWPLMDIPNSLFTILSGIIPLLTFNPLISIFVVAVTIPDILVGFRVARRDYDAVEYLAPKWRLWGWIIDHIRESKHFYENKIFSNVAYLARKLSLVQKEVLEHQYKRRIRRGFLRTWASIPANILAIILNAYFFALAIIGKITLGTAQLLYQSTSTLALGFSTFFNDAVSVYQNYLFVSDLMWFLELRPEIIGGRKSPSEEFRSGIEFKDVWFKYPNSNTWTLKGINFSIGPKDNLALVGENGAGKTTIIKLLSGFYQPTKGEILVNGVNIFKYNQTKYRDLLGILFQDFSQYPFTARESVGIGNVKKIGRIEEIKKFAGLTGVNKFIEELPLKYDNPLAKEFEKGIDPSKGQWQRIAIARILFRDSKIVVLDEPTSNVDPQAEEEIFEKIIKLAADKILILVSHRFSTVRRADKILLIEDGQVQEEGTHTELMKMEGEYAHLFHLQARGYQ